MKTIKNIAMLLLFFSAALPAAAQQKLNKNARHEFRVNGNCEQCKRRIEKAAFSVPGVKSADWHIDDHMLHVILNEEKTSSLAVMKAVAKAGHDTENSKATTEDYNSLDSCCQYKRE